MFAPMDKGNEARGVGGEGCEVEVVYRRRGGRMGAVVRALPEGRVLLAAFAGDPASALRAAARVLATCERRGYRVTKIEPFPWAWDASTALAANDDGASGGSRTVRRARGG
jgi:hypothetical protein